MRCFGSFSERIRLFSKKEDHNKTKSQEKSYNKTKSKKDQTINPENLKAHQNGNSKNFWVDGRYIVKLHIQNKFEFILISKSPPTHINHLTFNIGIPSEFDRIDIAPSII